MELRPVTDADIEACVDVLYEADDALTASFNLPPQPRNVQRLATLFRHVSTSSPGRSWLAEESGSVIGFGMAAQRGPMTFLSFLFVRSTHQARGVGRAIYQRCVPRDGYRATSISSSQPVAAALYASDGLVPRVPIYTFIGSPRAELPRLDQGLTLTPIEQREIDELDAEVVGLTRGVDHAAWQSWQRRPFALRHRSAPVGYGYAQPSGRIGPAVVRRESDLVPLVGKLMAQFDPPAAYMVHVPGVAGETFSALLNSGFRLDGSPAIYCATAPGPDYRRYLPGSFALP
jgi:hypothetical protein